MAYDPSLVADANKRAYSLPDTDVSTNETGVPLAVEITYADFPEFFDETAPVGQGEHPDLPEPTNHYTMDNISGATLTDEKADTNGTITNFTTTTGKYGDCLAGGSSPRYVDFGAGGISFKSASFWIKRNDLTKYETVATEGGSSGDAAWIFYLSANSYQLGAWNGSSTTHFDVAISDTTTWHHVVLVEGTNSNNHWAYIDGVKSSSEVSDNSGGIIRYLGRYISNAVHLAPDIDNVQIFDQILTQAQVTALYNAELPLYKKISAEQDGSQLPIEVSPNEWNYDSGTPANSWAVLYIPVDANTATGAEVTISADGSQDDNVYYVGLTGDTPQVAFTNATAVGGQAANTYARRIVIGSSQITAVDGKIRIKFAYYDTTWIASNVYIWIQASSGDNWDGEAGTGVQVTKGGNTDCTITSATDCYSDPIDFTIDGTDSVVIAFEHSIANGGAAYWVAVPTGCLSYLKAATGENDVADVSGYGSSTSWMGVVSLVRAPVFDVYDSNFAAVYHMAQDPSTGGACILDSTSNANHGTPAGTMLTEDLVDAGMGKGLDFDGGNDTVSIPSLWATDPTEVSVICAAKADTTGSTLRPFAYNDDGFYVKLRLNSGSANEVLFSGFDGSGNVDVSSTSYTVTDRHIYGMSQKESDYVRGYVDGTYLGQAETGTFSTTAGTGRAIGSGRTVNDPHDGIIDQHWIYEGVLSATAFNLISKAFLGTLWTVSAYSSFTDYTASANNAYAVDTTLGPYNIKLPATPSANDWVRVADYANNFGTNNCLIYDDDDTLIATLDADGDSIEVTYIDATASWLVTG